MEVSNILKFSVLVISFAMFCYQLNIATLNLMDPPTVDSTFERNIADYDIPVVTICPINQTNYAKLMELKYYTKENVLRGETSCHDTDFCKSWGAHLNLTFDELKSQIFDSYGVDRINVNGGRLQDKPSALLRIVPGLVKESVWIQEVKPVYFSEIFLLR